MNSEEKRSRQKGDIPKRPSPLRVVVFIDGQNFYNDCKRNFGKGETHPHLLGQELCSEAFGTDRRLVQVRFYTGIHTPDRNPRMHAIMTKRIEEMKRNDVYVFTRPLKYSLEWVKDRTLPDNSIQKWKGREKGVDVKLALDLVMMAVEDKYDVAVVVSTDTDLDEAVEEVLILRQELGRWIAVENAICVRPPDPDTGKRPPFKRLKNAGRLLYIDESIFRRIVDNTDYSGP
ncbi:MAG: NYN domain-containing protein [Actinobacteria bacterium]|nr:NYN domain-containing protein [Actinomycetota bacterium]